MKGTSSSPKFGERKMRLSVSNTDVNRAKNDAQILHEETRLKREMKKIESNVSVLKGNVFIKNTF